MSVDTGRAQRAGQKQADMDFSGVPFSMTAANLLRVDHLRG